MTDHDEWGDEDVPDCHPGADLRFPLVAWVVCLASILALTLIFR